MGSTDITFRTPIGLILLPQKLNEAKGALSPSISAGADLTIQVNNVPGTPDVGLWITKFSIAIDPPSVGHMLDTDGAGIYLYLLGASPTYLTAAQRNCSISHWYDWAMGGGDVSNNLWENIHIINNDSSAHTYAIAYKATTLSSVGSSSGFGGGSAGSGL